MAHENSRPVVDAWIALGANLGDPAAQIKQAAQQISRLPLTRLTRLSPLYQSAPVNAQGPDFINAAACLETGLSAPELLQQLQRVENQAGRVRPYPNAPRSLDLDIVFFGLAQVSSPHLKIPHPRWQERAFVVLPLADIECPHINPEMVLAVKNQVIRRID